MKKLTLFLIGIVLSTFTFAQNDDPTVLTIDGEDIPASEFMYIYTKNNDKPSLDSDSLDDYMELFINYKLKVREAKEQKYDTIPQLIKELAQYRKQLSLPYMTDTVKNKELIREAYDHTTSEVRARHILVRINPAATPADTNNAYVRIMRLRTKIINGEDFEDVAKSRGGSDDPSAKTNGGDLGYFTALQMVYPFEKAAFETPVGEVSMPIRTRFGYHIIEVVDKRPARGMIEAAHILVLAEENSTPEEKLKAKEKIDEIYQLLEEGGNFEELAAKYSDDQSSRNQGGILPVFGSGAKQRMIPTFENAAFAIENDGEYSKPIQTVYGYHIIKRVRRIPVPSFEEMERELRMRVERDSRAETTRDAFLNTLKKEYNYNTNADKLLPLFYHTMGTSYFQGQWKGLEDSSHDQDVLFSFTDHMYTVKDFEDHLIATQQKMRSMELQSFIQMKYNNFVKQQLMRYEDSQLEAKHPKFRAIMQEYSDGILIFEIMQDEVWNKASKDSAGIRQYFENNRSEFTYPRRYKGDLYKCASKKAAKAVYKMLKMGVTDPNKVVETMNKDSQLGVSVKTQTYYAENALFHKKKSKYRTFKKGLNKAFAKDASYYVFNVAEIIEPRLREFDEAKGLVTAAYQNKLEKEWIESLRKKYSYTIHTEALHSLKN